MRRTLVGALFSLLFVLSPAYPQTVTASAQTTVTINTTPVTGGSNGQCLTISSGTVGSATCGAGTAITVNTTTITGGSNGNSLYDNAGTVGERAVTGTGNDVLATSPTLVTPILGVAAATSLALGTVSSVTGTLSFANSASANLTTIQAGNAAAARTYTWPTNFGAAGTVLTDAAGNGTLSWAAGGGGGLTVGTSTITSGTTTRILYDNAGVLGEYTLTGTGTVAVMQTSPTLITPVLGVATATSVAIGGCTIGTDVLCTTGTTTHNGKTTVAGASFVLSGNISAAAWTTAGIRYANVAATLTDTSSSGTVAAAYTDVFGGNTVAASSATTFTNYYGTYVKVPAAGTNVTLTNAWGLGTEGINVIGQTNSNAIKETGYSLTGSSAQSLIDLSGTINTTGSPDVIALRITDTARGASTTLLNLYAGAAGATSQFKVDRTGNLTIAGSITATAGNITVGATQGYNFNARSAIASSANGQIDFSNNAATNLVTISIPTNNTFQFGKLDAASPVAQTTQVQNVIAGTSNTAGQNWTIKASAGTGTGAGGDILFQVAAAGTTGTSQNAFATAFSVKNTGVIQNNIIFSAAGTPLPTCNGAAEGSRGAVSDALTPTFLTAYASGGTTHASVYCDGTSWKTD